MIDDDWLEKAMAEAATHYQPSCPYCGHQSDCDDVHRTHTVSDNAEVKELTCSQCEKDFRYRITVTERYDSYPMEGEIDD